MNTALINVDVEIEAILLSCDESIAEINFERDYEIVYIKQDELPFKDRIVNGRGQLSTDYYPSRITNHEMTHDSVGFMCLRKKEMISVPAPEIKLGVSYFNVDLERIEYLEEYKDKEFEHINRTISLLQIFTRGDIGVKEIFFTFRYKMMGLISNTNSMSIDIKDANTIGMEIYKLVAGESEKCNAFIKKYYGDTFELMKNVVNEFTFGLKQIDDATGFEQFTTALEMIFLEKNQQGKKEVLSRRVTALLSSNDTDASNIYKKMKQFYRFRSESLHEGDGSNITKAELDELENITRESIKKYFEVCSNEINVKPSISWNEIKRTQISRLKSQVLILDSKGIFSV